MEFEKWDPLVGLTDELFQTTTEANHVQIRIQQRNARKSITTIQNINTDKPMKSIARKLSQTLHCSASIKNDKNFGEVIQIQGDVRNEVADFLVKEGICSNKKYIHIHGY